MGLLDQLGNVLQQYTGGSTPNTVPMRQNTSTKSLKLPPERRSGRPFGGVPLGPDTP